MECSPRKEYRRPRRFQYPLRRQRSNLPPDGERPVSLSSENIDRAPLRRNGTQRGHACPLDARCGNPGTSLRDDQFAVSARGFLQRHIRGWGVQNRGGNFSLVFRGKTENLGLLDGATRGFIRRGDDEICESPPLNFRSTLEARQNVIRKTCLKTSGGLGLAFHLPTGYGILPYGSRTCCWLLQGSELRYPADAHRFVDQRHQTDDLREAGKEKCEVVEVKSNFDRRAIGTGAVQRILFASPDGRVARAIVLLLPSAANGVTSKSEKKRGQIRLTPFSYGLASLGRWAAMHPVGGGAGNTR